MNKQTNKQNSGNVNTGFFSQLMMLRIILFLFTINAYISGQIVNIEREKIVAVAAAVFH